MGGNIGQPNRKLLKDYLNLFDAYNLECHINMFEQFNEEELKNAKQYLIDVNIEDYKAAVVEFKLCKK